MKLKGKFFVDFVFAFCPVLHPPGCESGFGGERSGNRKVSSRARIGDVRGIPSRHDESPFRPIGAVGPHAAGNGGRALP